MGEHLALTPEAAFVKLVETLGPYADDVIVLGGWASRLHACHPKAMALPDPALMTLDADIFLSHCQQDYRPQLNERLKEAGFVLEMSGEADSPIAKYRLPESKGFYVEFLTGKFPPHTKRDGTPITTLSLQGVPAQKLHYLHLAQFEPWQMGPLNDPTFPWPAGRTVNIVNPTCYITQKILTYDKRQLDKRGKDVLYVYDTLQRFGQRLDELAVIWQSLLHARPSILNDRDVRKLQQHRQFFEQVRDTHHAAAKEAWQAGRVHQPTAQEIAIVLQMGLARIFGPPA